ncbi:hypothetical protein PHLCEN_2v1661 [Hermanssonia centrifuga]|uniref:Heme peroxidase n=1 Tax=Hermanssonia centrifuga TaxID=98765 RepID=A0A2R6RZD8_9APHY|nr:hypothetical protein PHLCEN_2v1661 [Hermanssonia centrifuga]
MATKMQNAVVELLYNDLSHPPSSYIGPKYAYREADGSNNNLNDPSMGKAGSTYARSVQQNNPLPRNDMPDAGLVFDTLLKREKFEKHPAGLSSMMFSFAALVIHTVFRTSHENVNVNETSSYIDLAPLYGHDQATQNQVRMRNGRGYLHPDTFAEDRLLLLPPAVCVLLVLFNRNHNFIAKKLLDVNERGTFVDPDTIPTSDPERSSKILKQEEDIFQTARLINCAWFGSAVFSDYFSAILGLVRQGSNWSLNPFGEIRKEDHSLFERGRGNVCSVEFNCLYRWHATTSEHDEKWVTQMIDTLSGGKNPDDITFADMKVMYQKMKEGEKDLTHWTFGNLQRQEDGTFKDEDLAQILFDATEHPAAAFKARGTPNVMRMHEMMGIEQNRQWAYASFLEWNSNKDVAAAAEKLYGDINHLELYSGLQAEEAKPVVEGAGLCPSYTISRAILSDAIALTRGDRFFTSDYTPFNMTTWGFADCQRDPSAPGYGSTLGRLFLRALPNHYTPDSTYTWFPLMTPGAMQPILKNLNAIELYNFSRPGTKNPSPEIKAYRDVAQVLSKGSDFRVSYTSRAAHVITGKGFFIASDDPVRGQREQQAMLDALTGAAGSLDKITESFYQKTRELMITESWACVGQTVKNVDIVRDVLKYVPLYWACEVAGIRLSKDPDDGDYTPQALYDILTEIYFFLFLDFEHWQFIPLSQKVRGHIDQLLQRIGNSYSRGSRLSIAGVFSSFARLINGGGRNGHDELVSRFSALGYDNDTLANSILAILIGSTVDMSQALVHVVNSYLDSNSLVKSAISKGKLSAQDQATMQGLVLEALRLDPAFRGVYREAISADKIGQQSLKQNETIFVDIAKANMDPEAFPEPTSVLPNRTPKDRYLIGDGVSQ